MDYLNATHDPCADCLASISVSHSQMKEIPIHLPMFLLSSTIVSLLLFFFPTGEHETLNQNKRQNNRRPHIWFPNSATKSPTRLPKEAVKEV